MFEQPENMFEKFCTFETFQYLIGFISEKNIQSENKPDKFFTLDIFQF